MMAQTPQTSKAAGFDTLPRPTSLPNHIMGTGQLDVSLLTPSEPHVPPPEFPPLSQKPGTRRQSGVVPQLRPTPFPLRSIKRESQTLPLGPEHLAVPLLCCCLSVYTLTNSSNKLLTPKDSVLPSSTKPKAID